MRVLLTIIAAVAILPGIIRAQAPPDTVAFRMSPAVSRDEVLRRTLTPYQGQSKAGTSPATLTGKVMCGYQGWFTTPGDSSGRGWHHWAGRRGLAPGSCSFDFWPDVSELDADERYDTPFKLADGRAAQLYSPLNAKTVDRHFAWMEQYGIDGVFVQRFGVEVRDVMGLYHFNTVLANCRAAANRHGRTYAVMYDLSGLGPGETKLIKEDWQNLVDRMRLSRDPADKSYQQHRGKPLVAIWGIGFNDRRRYTVAECAELIDFFKNDPQYGGNSVLVGVPAYWRTLDHDSINDPQLHEIARQCDVLSPWMVGRFGTPDDVPRIAQTVWKPDLEWCSQAKVDYLPVVFPGFSWHNIRTSAPLGQIPRRGGQFLWKQFAELEKIGATMVYQAMFDEVNEGTAILKCTSDLPIGESQFLDFEGKPSDHYLWLVGQGGRLIRKEIKPTDALPPRE